MSTVERVRRVSAVDLMLVATVLLWALSIVVTRYVVTNGFHPLAYATVRSSAAILLSGSLNGLEIAGGVAIAVGIVVERRSEHAGESVVVLGE